MLRRLRLRNPGLLGKLCLASEVPLGLVLGGDLKGQAEADPVLALGVLRRLSDLGVRLAIDDFGSRHSSLCPAGELTQWLTRDGRTARAENGRDVVA